MSDELKINRPISGEISRGYKHTVQQKGPQEFLDAVDKLLAVDGVEGIAWTQYTPYFNDGDTCEFTMYEAGVKLDSRFVVNDMDMHNTDMYLQATEDAYFSEYDLYKYPKQGNWDASTRVYKLNDQDTREIAEALREFNSQIASFENVARDNFGDHAEVYADATGFRVEEHSHE